MRNVEVVQVLHHLEAVLLDARYPVLAAAVKAVCVLMYSRLMHLVTHYDSHEIKPTIVTST